MSLLSKCCNSLIRVAGDETEGTMYYECMKCGKPCDTKREKKKDKILVCRAIFNIRLFGYVFALGKLVKEFDSVEDLKL